MTTEQKITSSIRDPLLIAKIRQFSASIGSPSDSDAVKQIVERYFALNVRERQRLERKLHWKLHRNKGFRRLTSFASQGSKRTPKTRLLPRDHSPADSPAETAQ